MDEVIVIDRIKKLCEARSWTYYRLAKESGLTYSTLNTMINKSHMPSISTLSLICAGFGITLAQFFSDNDETVLFTAEQRKHMVLWDKLDSQGKQLADAYIQGLLDKQRILDA